MITLAIPAYEAVDLLDVAGPFEMFSWINGPDSPSPVTIDARVLTIDGAPVLSGRLESANRVGLVPQGAFADLPHPDLLWIPGGDPAMLETMMKDEAHPYLAYLREAASAATWVCSVCEGALLAGRAGLLEGHEATTHWAFLDCLTRFPGVTVAPGHPRYCLSGNRLTGGGISSGLDEALKLIELVAGTATAQYVQVQTQYFPDPPVQGEIPATPSCFVNW
jgi:transcriptional regulator GlxA family with amidase domain